MVLYHRNNRKTPFSILFPTFFISDIACPGNYKILFCKNMDGNICQHYLHGCQFCVKDKWVFVFVQNSINF